MTDPQPKFRITVRGQDTELRGYVAGDLDRVNALAEAMRPFGLVVASPAEEPEEAAAELVGTLAWWTTPENVVTLTRWMADSGDYDADQVAYAVEKPWKHTDLLAKARAAGGG